MKKFINVVLFILVIIICLLITVSLPNYDEFLSTKVFNTGKNQKEEKYVLFSDNNYSKGFDVHPVFSVANGNIQIKYKDTFVGLLPEGYSVKSDAPAEIFEVLLEEGNFRTSDDGSKGAYLLTFNKINTLFYCNFDTGEVVKVDDKVDSFSISPDGSYIVYATGYLYSNTLFVYKDGTSNYVAENVNAFYESNFNQIALKTSDNCLSVYSIYGEEQKIIAENVTDLCLPTKEGKYNYSSQFETFSIYFKRNDLVFSFVAKYDEEVITSGYLTQLTCGFKQAVPYQSFKSAEGVYKFFNKTGELRFENGSESKSLLKNVVIVYEFDGFSKFVLATNKAILLYDAIEDKSVELMQFGGRYKNYEDLIENDISVITDDYRTFYICSLDARSWIWKKSNPTSWLNRFSKYKYSLSAVNVQGDIVSTEIINFPSSNSLYEAIVLDGQVCGKIDQGDKTSVWSYDGTVAASRIEGNIEMMKNESGIYCVKFEDSNLTIYNLSSEE